jgi:dihydroorotase
MAAKHGTRLHVLHISTAKELELFTNTMPLNMKYITAEACMHHLWFTNADYEDLGTRIKWNPAIKTNVDRIALCNAITTGHIDVIATDHAPHTKKEKRNGYASPSGAPLVQHSLAMLYALHKEEVLTLEQIAEKAAYNPAVCFKIKDRGLIAEGYFADLAIFDPGREWEVDKSNIFYKCGWSPLEGTPFAGKNVMTIVNGSIVYKDDGIGPVWDRHPSMRLEFNR